MAFLLDTHFHTVSSGHAYSTVSEYAAEAAAKGLALIAMTDHAPAMPGSCGKFHFENLRAIPQFLSGVEILKGVEANIMDESGTLDLPAHVLKNLDVVIASLHVPCCPPSTYEANTNAYLNAVRNPHVHIIGHVGDARYEMNVERVVRAAKETGTLLELNNASLDPSGVRADGGHVIKAFMLACKAENLPVVLGSDAHFHTHIGNFEYALQMLREIDFPEELVVNTSVEKLKAALSRKGKNV